jgi:hypothetical protein
VQWKYEWIFTSTALCPSWYEQGNSYVFIPDAHRIENLCKFHFIMLDYGSRALPKNMVCMWDFVINAVLFRWPVVTELSANLY